MVVRRSFNVWLYRLAFGTLGLACLLIPGFLLYSFMLAVQYGLNPWPFVGTSALQMIPAALVLCGQFWFVGVYLKQSQNFNRARQEASQGKGKRMSLHDVMSSLPDQLLPLPFHVRLRYYWSTEQRVVFGVLFAILQGCFLCVAFFVQPTGGMPEWAFLLSIEAILSFILGCLLLTFIIMLRSRLMVTEANIMFWELGRRDIVRWSEVKLFAILKNGNFEVASATGRVELRIIDKPKHALQRPDIPFEEYQRKMDGLLLLIAARTGLPLMDLRDVEER